MGNCDLNDLVGKGKLKISFENINLLEKIVFAKISHIR